VYCGTGDRSAVTDHSASAVSDNAGLQALNSHQVYNSTAGQLITVISAPPPPPAAASLSQSLWL